MTKTTGNGIVENAKIAIIGLGYVGLPLAIEFGKKYDVLGFDINAERVKELQEGKDRTQEANIQDLSDVIALKRRASGEQHTANGKKQMAKKHWLIFFVRRGSAPTLQHLYRNCSNTDRPVQSTGSTSLTQSIRNAGQRTEVRRHCYL